jgi:hypothetical protein
MNTRSIINAVFLCALAACAQPTADHEAQGADLLAPFKQDLKGALIRGLESGPVAAISACSTEAPTIAGELSVDGVVMGRSSHRLRNPKNVAPEWAAPFLEAYAAGTQMGPVTIEYAKDRFGYLEPIVVQPMCLNCHGTAIDPEVAERINELYPDDEATGFSEGDFRGVFWVEFPGS